ncbi:hydrogenase formation protein HypD [Rosettibacter firmus]|uniref:hydrogenase formation protein HypD n=1 Tax=Rosettibacter firmus TaxID=3111522 RepID=UPI00336C2390
MKFIDEYRNADDSKRIVDKIKNILRHNWYIMEICGGQTHTILKYRLEEILPEKITLLHGPGCPVCVTSVEFIDKAIQLSFHKDVILTSYGDMLRVPGTKYSLLYSKSIGANVKTIYSPIDALKLAKDYPDKKIIFFAIGFETTAPATASSIIQARKMGLKNFFVLCAHVLVPPAIEILLKSQLTKIDGIIAAGHVCTVMGFKEYIPIAKKYKVPIVVTGFEPNDLLLGIFMTVKQLEEGRYDVENQYKRAVREEGNMSAKKIMFDVFEVVDRKWRGIGFINNSGLKIKKEFEDMDAEKVFSLNTQIDEIDTECIAGLILQGIKKPVDCLNFARKCTPENPLGAPMVSSEGSCNAYYKFGSVKINN